MSENEGELYNRLRKALEDELGTEREHYYGVPEFLKILDEAKQDYQSLTVKWKKKHPHPEVTDYHADALAMMREDWFEKWFGSAESSEEGERKK